jgi:hypothetical protein
MQIGLDMVWNVVLTLVLIPIAWALVYLNGRVNELFRHTANTREDVAKNYVTRSDVHNDLEKFIKRLDRIEEKIDRLFETK